MKKLVMFLSGMALCAAAHAELLAPKGAKATLTVEYVFTSSGKYTTGKKEQIDTWNVRRVVEHDGAVHGGRAAGGRRPAPG